MAVFVLNGGRAGFRVGKSFLISVIKLSECR